MRSARQDATHADFEAGSCEFDNQRQRPYHAGEHLVVMGFEDKRRRTAKDCVRQLLLRLFQVDNANTA